ncbi:MAG: cobyrinate a,c-diamide synthase [Candidatus Electrothrix aestuarii]|uniref:Cobyrinate a,c-diamide synthase n=1 Tax=Candidatus Electrothrix aestuarii TaxID=3062594 RepID=A0AAU8LYD7_9BACT|nr:cobyrinate a,c-diamide synthase [Candidatus Electrothrix aestuarii]
MTALDEHEVSGTGQKDEDSTGCLVIAGLSGGSGKSVASVALTAALQRRGYAVVPFKKGPDYIDAGWMSTAAGRPCYNLDPYLMTDAALTDSFQQHAAAADFALIEGNRGLYDGVTADGGFSTAELAVLLDLPVLLVMNCSKTTRTVAAMVLGCRELDRRVRIAGVILNQIATPRHERIITEAVEKDTGIPVVGIIPRMQTDIFPMRHLGVTPHQEYGAAASDAAVDRLTALAEEHFDLERITGLMEQRRFSSPAPVSTGPAPGAKRVRVGVLRDAAFQFYYQENLDALQEGGAELVMINALSAEALPDDLDALYIGGGFPETSARQLADNVSFRDSVRQAAEQGLPIYAECGGLIFLGRSIILEGEEFPLAGVFPVTFSMSTKPQAHGYSTFIVEQENAFYPVGTQVKGHEFRYSVVESWDGAPEELALRMERGTGFQEKCDGLVKKNVLALYTHVIAPGTPEWVAGLLRAAGLNRAF